MKNYFLIFIQELRALKPGDNQKFISERVERAGSYWALVLEKAARNEISAYDAAMLGYAYAAFQNIAAKAKRGKI